MKLVPIFVDEETAEGLYAISYSNKVDEFTRLFNLWTDTEYVQKYLLLNEKYLQTEYFANTNIDELVTKILDEAEKLEDLIYEYTESGFKNFGKNLQMIFLPLKRQEYELPQYQKTKAKIKDSKFFPKPILRIYAVRIGVNSFVISGGAIKLVRIMDEHPDTAKELEKFESVKSFLKQNDINTEDDLYYLL